jgi:hypothetical protein
MPRTSFLIGIPLVAPSANGKCVMRRLAPQTFLAQSSPTICFGTD